MLVANPINILDQATVEGVMTDSDDATANGFQANNLEEVRESLRSKGLAVIEINNVVPIESC